MGTGRNWRKAPWYLRYRVGGDIASWWRRLLVRLTHRHCHVEFEGPVYIGPGARLIETYVDRNAPFCCPSFERVTYFRFARARDDYVRYRTRLRRIKR